jgi:hypothetical protein
MVFVFLHCYDTLVDISDQGYFPLNIDSQSGHISISSNLGRYSY